MTLAKLQQLAANNNIPNVDFALREIDKDSFDAVQAAKVASIEPNFSKRFVDDLLQSCLSRITNCLVLRDKGHDIQTRALAAALDSYYQPAYQAARIAVEERLFNASIPKASLDALLDAVKDPISTRTELSQQKGHGLEYESRFKFLRELFQSSLVEAVARAKAAAKGLKDIYKITVDFPVAQPVGYLDELAKWVQAANDAFELENEQRRRRTVLIALGSFDETKTNQFYLKSELATALENGELNPVINDAMLGDVANMEPLLRELRIIVDTTEPTVARRWNCMVQLPGDGAFFPLVATEGDASLADLTVARTDVHNIRPNGKWQITLPKNTVEGELAHAKIKNVYLAITVSVKVNKET